MKKRLKVQALPKSIKNAEAYIGKEYKILKETDTTWVLEEDNGTSFIIPKTTVIEAIAPTGIIIKEKK